MRAVLLLAVLAALCAVVLAAPECASSKTTLESVYQSEFSGFVKRHTKKYTHDEFALRYAIFKANYNKIQEHNAEKHSYTLGVNQFADLTSEEFATKMTGLNAIENDMLAASNSEGPHNYVEAPLASLDWRTRKAVTPVKNQASCGSCWAFSATGSVEGAYAIKTGKLIGLSEQELVDCSRAQGNHGCNGGLMDQAFEWIIKNKGITSETEYPYTAKDGTCKPGSPIAATISKYVNVQRGSEVSLMNAVNIVPVSVAIQASNQVFQFYSGGILDNAACGQRLDHGVTLVGYATDDASGKDFYIVKNSWGQSWGEQGYIRMVRGKNQCGIASMASYAVV